MGRGTAGFAWLALLALAGCDMTAGQGGPRGEDDGAAVALAEFPERPLWGDTHVHTDNSIDAFGFGVRLGPEAALKFASGEEVTATTGIRAKLARPLDFLVITDHSDGLGATRRLYDAPRLLIRDATLRRWHDLMHEGPQSSQRAIAELITAAANGTLPEALRDPERQRKATAEIWDKHLKTIDRYNRPGVFTALAGFEYTLMPGGNNLHRNVIFRDGYERTSKTVPFPGVGVGNGVEQLWDYMAAYERSTGGQALAIPHNGNLSNGMMFALTMPGGGPMTAHHARRRARFEPVVEATQIKGDGEAHGYLSPNDEFASFGVEGWELGNLPLTQRTTPEMLGGNYVREALKRGLTIEARSGANPYKFGLIGSTDSHTALATGDEDNFFGKHTGNEPQPARALAPQNLGTDQGRFGWNYLAGGYAAVWARANTRGEIFDALKRREVYATTGPRMVLRLFAGHDFSAADWTGDWVRTGYARGVPMGGELVDTGRAPTLLINAMKDPDGANLDRVQVIKGWIDGIGTPQLRAAWTDPDYRPGQRAFYYLRLLEIPTPRWVLFDALRFRLTLPPEVMAKAVAQERAYSSPVWLNPAVSRPARPVAKTGTKPAP